MSQAVVNVKSIQTPVSATAGIQEAIAALPPEGGTVYLPPGQYALRRSVELPSNIRLRGEGCATVLTRPAAVEEVRVTQPTDGARTTLYTVHADGLCPGDQIYLRDDLSGGWHATHAIINRIASDHLELEILRGEAQHEFSPDRQARISNWFPCFWLRGVRDVTIENMVIDGGITTHSVRKCDFVVAAVHAHKSANIRIRDLSIRNWPGDGIGLQGGSGGWVTGCLVENCAGHGYHPGTGITQSTWTDNMAQRNTRDGFFFCLRVTHSTVRGNILVGNGGHGIGGLSDPDQYNTVIGNVCADNGMHGIDADKAIGNTIQGNICRNNSRSVAGRFAGIYLAGHRNNIVTGNVCVDDQPLPTQLQPLADLQPAGANIIRDNLCLPD